jgi:hypothetical protein
MFVATALRCLGVCGILLVAAEQSYLPELSCAVPTEVGQPK